MTATELSPTDLFAWATELCRDVDDLSVGERERAVDAYRYLRAQLGDEPFELAVDWNHKPLAWLATNRAPWTRLEVAELASELRAVSGSHTFPQILARLRRPSGWNEARSVLRIAARLVRAGATVEFDPAVQVGKRTKRPDIAIRGPGGWTGLAEVSRLQLSLAEQRKYQCFQDLTQGSVMGNGLSVASSGRIFRNLAPAHARELARELMCAAEEAAETRRLVTVDRPGVLEFAFQIEPQTRELEAWAQARGLAKNGFQPLDEDSQSTARVCNKIREKARQIPADQPGLISISGWDGLHSDDIAVSALGELEDEIFRYEQVVAVVLTGGVWSDPEPRATRLGAHCLLHEEGRRGTTDLILTIVNRFARVAHADAMRSLIDGAFCTLRQTAND